MIRTACASLLVFACGSGDKGGAFRAAEIASAKSPATPSAGQLGKDATFTEKVRPVLQSRCSPCHEKGGKMYARIPFDDPQALRSHVPGVRKRLKGDDLATFEAWLAEKPQ